NSLRAHRGGRGRRGGGSDRGERHGDRKSCGEAASEVLLHRVILLNSCGDRRFFCPRSDQRLGIYQLDSSRDYELRESKYQLFLVFLPVKLIELMQVVGRLFPFPWHRST